MDHHNFIENRLTRIEHSVGRIEKAVGLIQGACERIERSQMAIAQQLTEVNVKIDAFTTNEALVIDSAVTRIIAEIAKQGAVPPDVQAAADALSASADRLTAFNLANADKIINAGVPPPVPPVGPVPLPPPSPV